MSFWPILLSESCTFLGLKWSVFDVQWRVIPLKKALTKLFKCYFMTILAEEPSVARAKEK